MKKSFLLAIICFCYSVVFAQNPLIVQHNEKGMFINHIVSAKETFYSLGRMYNVSAKDIAAFNGVDMEKGLMIGETVHIPLTASNFSQEATSEEPVYYVVGQKEGLYRVSLNNNKVLMANLRKWNNLTSDNLSTGQKVIVGYLISPEAKINTVAENKEKKADVPEKKNESLSLEENPVQQVKQSNNQISLSDNSGGYFRSEYLLQTKSIPVSKDEQATAGIFKTASGWQDGKYYALMDGVEPGTIIRITNPNNNKSVFAKVLDKMAGIRQNQGYDVRISNAAATALDVTDTDKFFVRVNY